MASDQYVPAVNTGIGPGMERGRLERYIHARKQEVDKALAHYLEPRPETPFILLQAMRYITFGGGKRLRPILLLAAYECCGGKAVSEALPLACALEMIHIASLIHDDLPSMDNDDFRRGLPSLHKVYGEAVAILAGDALIVYAFQIAAQSDTCKNVQRAIVTLARAVGACGLAGGQVLDLMTRDKLDITGHQPQPLDQVSLDQIYRLKTAALIEAAMTIGALSAGASPAQVEALGTYGHKIGLAFQVIDDILDKDADCANGNLSYCAVHGREASEVQAQDWGRQAREALESFGARARMLHEIADFILHRKQ